MRRCGLIALALLSAAPAGAATKTYALVVAENKSQDPATPALRYADDDGVRNFELFSLFADQAALFAVLDDDTARVHPDAARRAEVDDKAAIVARLFEWNRAMEADLARGDEPELYIVYAGHGDVDATGMGYVSLHDGKLTRADLFRELVAPSKARFVHLVIDACKSYFMVNARGGTWKDDRAPESHDAELSKFLAAEAVESYPRVGVIVATSGDQETHEWSRYRGGILSHELRSALLGAADVNGDGRIEYSELRAFIAAANARVTNPEARLDVFARPPAADRHRALTDLRRAREAKFLHFAPGEHGQFYLEDDRGLRYADLNKDVASQFDVALAPGTGYFVRRDEREEAEVAARIKPRKIELASLHFRPRAIAERGSLDSSFRKDLYQVPFGRGFYDGFVATSGDLPVDGEAAPFVIKERRDHALSAGYLVSGAPLSASGAIHSVDVRYAYHLVRALRGDGEGPRGFLDAGLAVQAGAGGDGGSSLTRVAVMAAVAGEVRPASALGLRLDVAAGWQYSGGNINSKVAGLIAGSDPAGARVEVAGGIVFDVAPSLGFSARGGLAIDVSTISIAERNYSSTAVNLSPLLNISAIVRL